MSQFQAEPKNVVLVHGEAGKMDFLKQKIEKEFGKDYFMESENIINHNQS